MDKLGYKLMLFDAYGGLLTDKQQQALALTYNEDYSLLGELAQAEQNASWQQVAAVRQQLLQLIAPDKEEN